MERKSFHKKEIIMSRKAQIKKKAQRELEMKKAKRRKKIVIGVIAVLLLALAIAIAVSVLSGNGGNGGTGGNDGSGEVSEAAFEVFSDGTQTVMLLPDGTFAATLAHEESENGTFTKETAGDKTLIGFDTVEGTVFGTIEGDVLYIPEEWQDDHGHGSALTRIQ